MQPRGGSWIRYLALGGALLVPLVIGTLPVSASPPVRIVQCDPGSLSEAALANGILGGSPVAASPDDEDDTNDQVEEDQQPKIKGSIEIHGVNEDNSKQIAAALAANGIQPMSKDDALASAHAALSDADLRTFKTPKLELENKQVVWAIETKLNDRNSSVNPELEVKVDAGNGDVLSVECD